jgi:hypothetical protein
MLLAAQSGLVLFVISCLLGIWVSVNGDMRVAAGLEPERAQFGDERIHRRTVGRTPGDSSAKVVRQSPEQVVARAIGEQRGDDRRERRLGRKLRG